MWPQWLLGSVLTIRCYLIKCCLAVPLEQRFSMGPNLAEYQGGARSVLQLFGKMFNGKCFNDDLKCCHTKKTEPYEVFRLGVIMMHESVSARSMMVASCVTFPEEPCVFFFQVENWMQRRMNILSCSWGVFTVSVWMKWKNCKAADAQPAYDN